VTSIPEITRMLARIADWKEAREKARGRAETDHMLGEADRFCQQSGHAIADLQM
jgi:hypothetical protein